MIPCIYKKAFLFTFFYNKNIESQLYAFILFVSLLQTIQWKSVRKGLASGKKYLELYMEPTMSSKILRKERSTTSVSKLRTCMEPVSQLLLTKLLLQKIHMVRCTRNKRELQNLKQSLFKYMWMQSSLQLKFANCAPGSLFCHFSSDPPSEPRDLEIEKYDKGSVSLKWKPPTSDGGNPIQGIRFFLQRHFVAIFVQNSMT